jgi:shikimate dehydrogenase
MVGHPGSPVPVDVLHDRLWVADIVYFPLETTLLSAARAIGCRTLDGSGMAVFQAAAAFDVFTGVVADRDRMLRSFAEFS